MSERGAGTGGTCPSGWWYGLAAAIAMATLVVTAIAGYARATDLKAQVDGFQHFGGSGGTTVSIAQPGEYAVYHEWVERGGGEPYATGTPAAEPTITVTAPDGSAVPVRPSGISYGWGSEQAEAVGTFDVTQPGDYRIDALGAEGRLAFGEKIAGSPFYGFGGALLAAAAIVVGSVVGSLVVAKRRRDWRRRAEDCVDGSDGSPSEPEIERSRPDWLIGAVGVGVAVVIGGVLAFAARDDDDGADALLTEGPAAGTSGDAEQPSTTSSTVECVTDEDFATGLCGNDPSVLRETNLHYADRIDFSGDRDAARAVVDQARAALAPLAGVLPYPSPDQVREALTPLGTDVQVSDNAVRTSGAAFGIAVDGGCVFGSVFDGAVEVEIGGYINDGGCLAEYAH